MGSIQSDAASNGQTPPLNAVAQDDLVIPVRRKKLFIVLILSLVLD